MSTLDRPVHAPGSRPRGLAAALAIALGAAALLGGCLDDDPALVTSTDEAPLSGKLSPDYAKLLRPFGFEASMIAQRFTSAQTKEGPAPRRVPLLLVMLERRYPDATGACPNLFPRSSAEIEARAFGHGGPSVPGYFEESSHGRFTYTRAGVVHVCGLSPEAWAGSDKGYTNLLPPVMASVAKQFPIMDYDRNRDGVVTPEELTVLVLDDWDDTDGQTLWYSEGLPNGGRYEGLVSTSNASAPLFQWCHELGHTLGADDLYGAGVNFRATLYGAPTSDPGGYIHMDAWTKLRLGWLRPDLVDLSKQTSDTRLLYCSDDDRAEVEGSVLFWDPARGHDQYLLIEARCQRGYDVAARESGVAIWQVVQSANHSASPAVPAVNRTLPPPSWDTCVQFIDGTASCPTPGVCAVDASRDDDRGICRDPRFLQERAPSADGTSLAKGLPLWWFDQAPAGASLLARQKVEYLDYGVPGYHHVEHLIGYEVTWRAR